MRGGSVRYGLHLIHGIMEGMGDDGGAVLISLDRSGAFDGVHLQFLATVLETAEFEPEFRKWIGVLYHVPRAVVQVGGRCSRAFVVERSVRQGCPLSPLYVLALEPLLRRLRSEGSYPALRGIPLAGSIHARISACADDVTVFVSSRLDMLAVMRAVKRCERVAAARVNFGKSEGLRLGAWRRGGLLPGPFR